MCWRNAQLSRALVTGSFGSGGGDQRVRLEAEALTEQGGVALLYLQVNVL